MIPELGGDMEDGWTPPAHSDLTHLVMAGLCARDVPPSVLDRVLYPPGEAGRAMIRLLAQDVARESVIVGTDQRVEVYAVQPLADPARLGRFLAEDRGLRWEGLQPIIVLRTAWDAARHLFRLASGLDSAGLDEGDARDQVEAAYRDARSVGTVGPTMEHLMRWAVAQLVPA
jgi:glutamyl-tRNA reductase